MRSEEDGSGFRLQDTNQIHRLDVNLILTLVCFCEFAFIALRSEFIDVSLREQVSPQLSISQRPLSSCQLLRRGLELHAVLGR